MFLIARVETKDMSFQYLEKIRSKLRSIILTDANRPLADLAKRASNDERQTIDEKQDIKNKSAGLKNSRCWSPQKPKSLKKKEKMDEKFGKKAFSLDVDKLPEEEIKTVFAMSESKSQPSPKMGKKDEEKKVKKYKTKETKLVRESLPQAWDETDAKLQVGKVKKKWGWEKREGEDMKKTLEKKALENLKESKEYRVPEPCKCGRTKDVTVVVKDFCECETAVGNKIDLGKLHSEYRKQKPRTAPHLTDSLIVYKERISRKSNRYDKAEDEMKEGPVKRKEGKGVSFSKDVVFRRKKDDDESLITLFQNSGQTKSSCGLTKEQFEKFKSCPNTATQIKGKLL